MIIPCKECITYPICKNKEIIRCSKLYEDIVIYKALTGDTNKKTSSLYSIAKYLGHNEWGVSLTEKKVTIYTTVPIEPRGEVFYRYREGKAGK